MTAARTPVHRHRARTVTLIIVGSVVAVAALALGAVLTVGGVFVSARYLEPWEPDYHQQFDDPRMQLVAHAVLAPSGHNMQPWIVELDPADPDVLTLFVDADRLTPAVDPFARQTLVSQGTFLAYLEVAAAELGYSVTMEFFPEGEYDEADLATSMTRMPVARVTLTDGATASTEDYASLFLSDTNRAPYGDEPLGVDEIAILEGLAQAGDVADGVTLEILTAPSDLTRLGDLGVVGTRIETEYAAATAESNAVFFGTEVAKNDARSGFAVEGQGTTGFMKYLLQGLITIVPSINDDASAATMQIALTDAAVAATPAYALITTARNTRTEQVEAGILYGQLSLRARTLGLVMQPLSQVLQEYPTMAEPYAQVHAEYAPDGGTIQMLVRVGTPTTEYPVTMRRDAGDLVRPTPAG
jgi:hypothetical protein